MEHVEKKKILTQLKSYTCLMYLKKISTIVNNTNDIHSTEIKIDTTSSFGYTRVI